MPRVHEVYSCPECAEDHDTETEALNCCPIDDTGVRFISAADLEAQGQMRLELNS